MDKKYKISYKIADKTFESYILGEDLVKFAQSSLINRFRATKAYKKMV